MPIKHNQWPVIDARGAALNSFERDFATPDAGRPQIINQCRWNETHVSRDARYPSNIMQISMREVLRSIVSGDISITSTTSTPNISLYILLPFIGICPCGIYQHIGRWVIRSYDCVTLILNTFSKTRQVAQHVYLVETYATLVYHAPLALINLPLLYSPMYVFTHGYASTISVLIYFLASAITMFTCERASGYYRCSIKRQQYFLPSF